MEEQHAVPQDITGFQFKLVGDMTLKQFGELAFGAIMAYLFFASNWHPFLKWPLVFFFSFLGVALAFIPVEERPLDVWISNFFKAIYKPTYYVWKKTPFETTIALSRLQPPPEPRLQLQPQPQLPPSPAPQPTSSPVGGPSIDELQKIRDEKIAELNKPKPRPERPKITAVAPPPTPSLPDGVLTVDKLVKKWEENKPPEKTIPPLSKPEPSQPIGPVRVVEPIVKPTPTISLTEMPNIINGTVADQNGGPLEGVIMVIKDKTGNSVRALKTNKIGQFIASTPLENGTYYLEFEIPNYTFETYEITLDGKVITPLTIKGVANGHS